MTVASDSGIYVINNTKNGKVYIGSTVNFEKRWAEHRRTLCKGTHCNSHLQSSWNKHGESVFEFGVLKYVDDLDELLKIEQFWMGRYREEGRELYNIALTATCPMLGRKHSEKSRQQMSTTHTGSTQSKEVRHKISMANEGNQHFLGHKHSEDTKCRMSKSHKGKIFTKEHKRNIGKAHAKSYPAFVNEVTGEFIPAGINLCAMCRERGVVSVSMRDVSKGRQRQHHGWVLAGDF